MAELDRIIVQGAREHNLKNISVEIPRDAFVVVTGLSGSGKSSLAFDTVYAEGQRRYMESLSAYARQFLGIMEKPDVDFIDGLSPAISIEQKTVAHNPRSTVGTVTEVYDYLRLLFARVGVPHCVKCGGAVSKQSEDQIVENILSFPAGMKVLVLAPVVRGRKGHYRELFEQIMRDGYVRVRVDGAVREITAGMKVERFKVHDIEVVVDRIEIRPDARSRIADSVENALKLASGMIIVNDGKHDRLYSQHLACLVCGISYEEPAPNSFSFNSPYGACPSCNGLGITREFSTDLIIPDPGLSIEEGGLAPFGKPRTTWHFSQIRAVAERYGIPFSKPLGKWPKKALHVLLHGGGDEKFDIEYRYGSGRTVVYKHRFNGLIEILRRYYEETASSSIREWAESFMSSSVCRECGGGRLRKESLAVRLVDSQTGDEKNIAGIVSMAVDGALSFFELLSLTPRQEEIAHQVVKEIRQRLKFLVDVGLDYLTLDRSSRSLSGGEAQRIRLATQIGSQLVGVLYVLDEPSIGLHQRDNLRLIRSLKGLRDLGNTVLVVEHDREMMERADYIIDLGPGAGEHGGYVVATGPPEKLIAEVKSAGGRTPLSPDRFRSLANAPAGAGLLGEITFAAGARVGRSLTLDYLSGRKQIETATVRRKGDGKCVVLKKASGNNLKNVDVRFPLGLFICVTGVSGSGKSTLINETLYPVLARELYKSKEMPLPFKKVEGIEHIRRVVSVDQSPIGRTPRSNPATYTGLFTSVRDLFAQLPESKLRGYQPGRFSFNVRGGRCDECDGDGVKKIEMNFLPDVYVLCDACGGKRYNRETLDVLYKGESIADVLGMTVTEALEFFADVPAIRRKLETLHDVGLGYIRLGQQATTLSGGEAQRVKLSTELSKVGTGKTLYVLDEPTTGLHFEDVRMLLSVLNKLVDKGNTVIVIEHNMDVIKSADWLIDLGPEGGEEGGQIVAEGPPENVAKVEGSYTGQFLLREFQK